MKHSFYNRLIVKTGQIEQLPFGEVDGFPYGIAFERGEGVYLPHNVALEIVNKWNSISAYYIDKYIYWL